MLPDVERASAVSSGKGGRRPKRYGVTDVEDVWPGGAKIGYPVSAWRRAFRTHLFTRDWWDEVLIATIIRLGRLEEALGHTGPELVLTHLGLNGERAYAEYENAHYGGTPIPSH